MNNPGNYAKEIQTDSDFALENGGWYYRRLLEAHEGSNCIRHFHVDNSTKYNLENSINTGFGKREVFIIRKEVSEFGTYKVEVTITANQEKLDNLTLFAGRRNLVARGISIPAKAKYKKTFYQAVMPYIPALSSKRNNDKCVFVSIAGIKCGKTGCNYIEEHNKLETKSCDEKAMFKPLDSLENNDNASVQISITKEDVPVIWIAGDSTLTDQSAGIPYYPYGSCAGWAQMLQQYVDDAAVCNLAHSGMTTKCFRDDGHYAIFQEFAKPGDFFIMQFGHNDQKRRNLAAFGEYSENLRRYTNEVRQKGVEPVICSPISRIPLSLSEDEAKKLSMARHYSLLQEYADAAKSVAKELGVAFVDLHEKTFSKWIELGDKAKDYFMPGDITHTNEYGAVLIADIFTNIARCGRKEYIDSSEKQFIHYLAEDLQKIKFLPDFDTKDLPKEAPAPSPFDLDPPYLDIEGIPEYEGMRKAYKYGLLDPCVMYLHPYDPMPRGQLLMVMFNAFRMAGVRPYKKKYPDIKVDEWISGYVQAMIEKGYIDENEKMFRPDDPLTYGEFADFLMKRNVDAAKLVLLNWKDVSEVVNRAEVYTTLALFMDKIKEISGEISSSLPEDAEVHPVH